jgi:pantoate--beta-alanine ligase
MAEEPSIVVDYFAVADRATLQPVPTAGPGTVVMTAARVGPTRLIDNIVLGEATTGVSGARPG